MAQNPKQILSVEVDTSLNWRTIKENGLPPAGTECLARLRHEFNSWSDYTVLCVAAHPFPHFEKFDLIYPDKDVEKYIPLKEIDPEYIKHQKQ